MISIQHLTFGYKKSRPVLEDLSLELKPGHIYGLLGKNGAGKSSLLHTICGLLFPGKGTVRVTGEEPARRSAKLLQQTVLLPEEFYVPNGSVHTYVDNYAPFYPTFDRALFSRMLAEFEVPADSDLQKMSYGQKKKMMISFVLATRAKVLLMDEPTNGLDIPSKRQFRKVIAGTAAEDQVIIISTHQVRDLDSLIDHVLILEDKRIIIREPVERITQKLVFKQVNQPTELIAPIYYEGGLKGYAVVGVNHDEEESRLDMEIFFNAVLSEKQQIVPLFNA
ncbi:ABC transporter ATP-binding protein [Hufsiella ginkgonis]|uniref:ATP-binding cassette domain-containing protein n=1 Tax=Hufsiella ginkgonis TaxID=2695274 RepID=A0A7K1Y3V2_9SPHI|nr:ABC transporter ATP-binding protein [Hufsiella ginkgonis]MXV17931.1 ATP-binding cassette domain-containing protein [Hufsiella ginkgonis]